MFTPEIGEIRRGRFREDAHSRCLAIHGRMRPGKIVRTRCPTVEQLKFDGAFDGAERGFDDEGIVPRITECSGAGEEPARLPELEKCPVLDIESRLDLGWSMVERGLGVGDELLNLCATHRPSPSF
jgi:hypothetical protein